MSAIKISEDSWGIRPCIEKVCPLLRLAQSWVSVLKWDGGSPRPWLVLFFFFLFSFCNGLLIFKTQQTVSTAGFLLIPLHPASMQIVPGWITQSHMLHRPYAHLISKSFSLSSHKETFKWNLCCRTFTCVWVSFVLKPLPNEFTKC